MSAAHWPASGCEYVLSDEALALVKQRIEGTFSAETWEACCHLLTCHAAASEALWDLEKIADGAIAEIGRA